jgi:multidrug efflux pump subunit AcrA (membrane-fusion protein)
MRKLLYLFVLSSFWACNQSESHPVADTASKAAAPRSHYVFGEVAEAEIGSTVHLPAVLKPFEMVDIYPKINGFVKEIPVDRGSRVRSGQLLIRLEAPEIEQQYMAAKAKYLQAYY